LGEIYFDLTKDVEDVLSGLRSYSEKLGLNLRRKENRFKWFLASMLFAKRISAEIAKKTFRGFVRERLTTPDKLIEAGWDRIVDVLDSGGYVRYDFSTATNILDNMRFLVKEYEGDVDKIHKRAKDSKDLEKMLMEFKGFGPMAVNIFLRELRGIWAKADPQPSRFALETAKKLGIKDLSKIKDLESKLVRLHLEYCKKQRCTKCPVREFCGR